MFQTKDQNKNSELWVRSVIVVKTKSLNENLYHTVAMPKEIEDWARMKRKNYPFILIMMNLHVAANSR